jgi:hypothetical protein
MLISNGDRDCIIHPSRRWLRTVSTAVKNCHRAGALINECVATVVGWLCGEPGSGQGEKGLDSRDSLAHASCWGLVVTEPKSSKHRRGREWQRWQRDDVCRRCTADITWFVWVPKQIPIPAQEPRTLCSGCLAKAFAAYCRSICRLCGAKQA